MNDDASSFTFASIGDRRRARFVNCFKQSRRVPAPWSFAATSPIPELRHRRKSSLKSLRVCSVPVIGVLGNHDYESGHADEVKRILCDAGVHLLDGQAAEVNGVAFIGVKGFAGGFGPRMLSSFGEPAIKTFVAEAMNEAMRLENIMRTVNSRRAVVVLHYAPIVDTVEGEPLEIYPFLGCSRLAETIDRFKVCAVVHGHAHRGKYEGRTPAGARVYNVAMGVQKPSGLPYALISV